MIPQACVIALLLAADPPPMQPESWPKDVKVDVTTESVKPGDAKAHDTTRPEPRRAEPRRDREQPAEPPLSAPPVESTDREIGAVAAPAALPAGGMAFYGILGAPDLGGGYRQGFGPVELEARALFNYLELSGLFEGGVRIPVYRNGNLAIAPGAAVGLKLDSGARYYDRANFAYVGIRLRASANVSYKLSETIMGVGLVDVPWAIALGKSGHQITPTLGIGAEFHLGDRLSLLASVHGGFDVIKEPLGVPQWRPAWGIRLGIGYRMF